MMQCTLGLQRCAIKNFGAGHCQFHEHIFKRVRYVKLKSVSEYKAFEGWFKTGGGALKLAPVFAYVKRLVMLT
jgi:hypothetical protein